VSPSVTGQGTPDIKIKVRTGSVKRTPGIRKTMMLQIARGIRSRGKPITDIAKLPSFKREN
jgi:hypothetical protein